MKNVLLFEKDHEIGSNISNYLKEKYKVNITIAETRESTFNFVNSDNKFDLIICDFDNIFNRRSNLLYYNENDSEKCRNLLTPIIFLNIQPEDIEFKDTVNSKYYEPQKVKFSKEDEKMENILKLKKFTNITCKINAIDRGIQDLELTFIIVI